MAITLVPMTCPQCGATIDAPVNQDECFCTYCGAKILINNENVKTININKNVKKTNVDEAKIAEVELKNKKLKIIVAAAIVAAIALIITIILAVNGNYIAMFALLIILGIVFAIIDRPSANK